MVEVYLPFIVLAAGFWNIFLPCFIKAHGPWNIFLFKFLPIAIGVTLVSIGLKFIL